MNTSKGTEQENKEGATEVKVETVDYRSPPGTEGQPPVKEDVEITHVIPAPEDEPAPGIVATTVSKVSDTIESAKVSIAAATAGGITAAKD